MWKECRIWCDELRHKGDEEGDGFWVQRRDCCSVDGDACRGNGLGCSEIAECGGFGGAQERDAEVDEVGGTDPLQECEEGGRGEDQCAKACGRLSWL